MLQLSSEMNTNCQAPVRYFILIFFFWHSFEKIALIGQRIFIEPIDMQVAIDRTIRNRTNAESFVGKRMQVDGRKNHKSHPYEETKNTIDNGRQLEREKICVLRYGEEKKYCKRHEERSKCAPRRRRTEKGKTRRQKKTMGCERG